MPTKERAYQLTIELLRQYRDAALVNAQALLEESTLLLGHRHYARAYFLSVSCIEEAGKAVQAFEGLGRNLKDPAVTQRLKLHFEDHSQKVISAFSPLFQVPRLHKEIMGFMRIIVDLQFGREASMYTDINAERAMVTTPQMQISEKAASNCVRLADTAFAHVRLYAQQLQPKTTTPAQNAFFALKPATFQKMVKTSDFWEYYISRMEKGSSALEDAVTEYNRCYLSKDKLFKTAADATQTGC